MGCFGLAQLMFRFLKVLYGYLRSDYDPICLLSHDKKVWKNVTNIVDNSSCPLYHRLMTVLIARESKDLFSVSVTKLFYNHP